MSESCCELDELEKIVKKHQQNDKTESKEFNLFRSFFLSLCPLINLHVFGVIMDVDTNVPSQTMRRHSQAASSSKQ
jgi:hypothetical protein